jgi:hypothetical protein
MNSHPAPDTATTKRAFGSSLPYDLGIIVPVREGYFLGPNPYKFPVSKVAGVDIDVLEDFQIARSLRWLYEGAEQPAAV